jgi:hypothetical protein
VTQQFNTASSMGRLILNVLVSFAQFEREIIGERTRDKIAATRRKGKWAGGHPVLGYDIDPKGYKLAVNAAEAERVRQIFSLYLEHGSLLLVVEELARCRWNTKRWKTRKGPERGGKPFTRSLYTLLTNVVYAGKVCYKTEVHDGEHPAIVAPGVFQQVQDTPRRNGRTGGGPVRRQFGAPLKAAPVPGVQLRHDPDPHHPRWDEAVPVLPVLLGPEERTLRLPLEVGAGGSDRGVRGRAHPVHRSRPGPAPRGPGPDPGQGRGPHRGPGNRGRRTGTRPETLAHRGALA